MVQATDTHESSLRVERTVEIAAPIQTAYESLLEMLGPEANFDGTPMPMTLEAWPGGRWFRDLGEGRGHWWGQVQAIKPPTLIEISGPLFMSYPALSYVGYRLEERGDETTLSFVHRAIGELSPDHCRGVNAGWEHQLEQIKRRAQAGG